MRRMLLLIISLIMAGPLLARAQDAQSALERVPYYFDAGPADSEIRVGAMALAPDDAYDSSRGYGWAPTPEEGFVRPNLRRSRNALTLDGVAGQQVGFRADVPPGNWWLTLLVEAGLEDVSTLEVSLGTESAAPSWQRFDPPAEGRTQLQKIYRLLHWPVDVGEDGLRFSLVGGADSVRVLGFSLFPDPTPVDSEDLRLLERLNAAGKYGSDEILESLVAELAERVAADPTDTFAAYWYEQVSWLRLAEEYREKMGWEWARKEMGLGIFDRYHGAVMILDGLLDRPDAERWPFYERALFERARLLYWLALERGGEHERREAERNFSALSTRYPDDPLIAMYNGELVAVPGPCDDLRPAAGAPRWSVMQLEALCRMRAEVHWWVRERQIDNGEFGGKLGDDVELLRAWHPLFALGDTVALRGLRTLADGVWFSDQIQDGYAAAVSDVEHASEFIADTAPALALFSQEPAYLDRLRPSARHFEELWTGYSAHGRRFFKSAWFSSSEIASDPPKNRDVNYNTRAAKALRFLAHRTGDERVIELLEEWSSAWVHAARRTDKGKPTGIVPASVRFPDEAINGDESTWYDPEMYWSYFRWSHDVGSSILDQLLHSYLLTRNDTLLEPLFAALDLVRAHEDAASVDSIPGPGSAAWAAAHLRDEPGFWSVVEAWRLRTEDDRHDDLILRYGTPYLRYRLTHDESHLEAGLDPLLEALRHNVPLRTTEVLHTDRVYMPGYDHLQAMLAGGGTETSPYASVSWSDADSLFTSLVTESAPKRLEVVLYSHNEAPATVGMHAHELPPGRYKLTQRAGEKAAESHTVTLRGRGARINLLLSPRVPVTVRLEAGAAVDDDPSEVSVEDALRKTAVDDDDPREVAARVARQLVTQTRLELVPALERARQEGTYALDFVDALGPTSGGLYYARTIIDVAPDAPTSAALGLSLTPGELEIRIGDDVVHRGSDGDAARITPLDYDLIRFERNVPLTLSPGKHEMLIKLAAESGEARLVLGFVDPGSGITVEGWSLRAPGFEDEAGFAALVVGPFAGDLGSVHSPDTAGVVFGADYDGLDGRRVGWDKPRVHVVSAIPEPLAYSDWRYFTGTFLDALTAVSRTFEGLDFNGFVDRHMDFFLAHRDALARERERFGLRAGAFGHYFRFALLDDMGMQAVPLLERIRRGDGTSADSALVLRVVDHIMHRALRLPDGTFARLNPDSLTVWADDLFMGTMLLTRAAGVLGRPDLIEESAKQALRFHERLLDSESGLYWHGWFARTEEPSSSKWARANGWTMLAKTELLLALPDTHPLFDEVLETFRTHAAGLVRVQSEDGRWHQVLDNPETYLETSSTAMFVRAFADGVRRGWLPERPYREAAERGWAAVARQVRSDGQVEGIVRGTPIFYSDAEYDSHSPRLNDPRGLGAVLYAAVAMQRLWTETL